ncbi:DUF4365 domain-containing protein [Amycolatopsis sp. NPDC057786]|uniref:DUF4365 domain-containing protein n=1 Tax=Amycolatopsis sp. NPDC057786 TaxID=3346250 RepID=UPI00367195DD
MGLVLSKPEHQGAFGQSFVHVLASAAGLTVAREDIDSRGFDLTIGHKGKLGQLRHPNIEVQVKSWSKRIAVEQQGYWKYELRTRHYNELAGTDFMVPRFLVLVIVPDDWHDYVDHAPSSTELRHAAYWMSLRDHPTSNLKPDSKVRVDVPVRNLLTVDSLHAVMKSAATLPVGA